MEISRSRALPGGRAVLGGVLMAVAVVGVFVAYDQAGQRPTDPIVVAAGDIRAGERIEADDLRVTEGELPDGAGAFEAVDGVIGHVALVGIAEGDVVQPSAVTDDTTSSPAVHEVAVTLPRDQLAVGRLKVGERVDVFVTYETRTASVVRGATVVQIEAGGDDSLTSDREVTLVVAVPSGDAVAALVHALRTGDVTVVRSTFGEATTDDPIEYDGAPTTSTTVAASG